MFSRSRTPYQQYTRKQTTPLRKTPSSFKTRIKKRKKHKKPLKENHTLQQTQTIKRTKSKCEFLRATKENKLSINLNLFGQTLGKQDKFLRRGKFLKQGTLGGNMRYSKQVTSADKEDEKSRLEFLIDENEMITNFKSDFQNPISKFEHN